MGDQIKVAVTELVIDHDPKVTTIQLKVVRHSGFYLVLPIDEAASRTIPIDVRSALVKWLSGPES